MGHAIVLCVALSSDFSTVLVQKICLSRDKSAKKGREHHFLGSHRQESICTASSQQGDPHHKEGVMQPRPTIALILRAFVYAACQLLAYKAYGVPILIVAWAIIVIGTWIDIKTTTAKVAQTAVQTAWFAFILGVIHMNQIAI